MRRGNMAKLNVWFARGFSARVKSVRLPATAVTLDMGSDTKGVAVEPYFKDDIRRFRAWMAGVCLAHHLFGLSSQNQDDDDPDHNNVQKLEVEAWKDARNRPKGYPLLLTATYQAFPRLNFHGYDVDAPLFYDVEDEK
jgi:hypothetical protein